MLRDGKWVADDTALQLQEQSAWAMLLNEGGDVIPATGVCRKSCRRSTPVRESLLSAGGIWRDYPVKIWTRADGNLYGCRLSARNAGKILFFSLGWPHRGLLSGVARFYHQSVAHCFLDFEEYAKSRKAMTPILQGIQNLSHGKAPHLEEQGAGRDQRRTEPRCRLYEKKSDNLQERSGIRGESPHDIRTPLLDRCWGYASEEAGKMTATFRLEARKAGRYHPSGKRKMKRLIDDLEP